MVIAQADSLIDRGHTVHIFTRGEALSWRASRAEWVHLADFASADLSSFDAVVATFWTTVEPAWRKAPGRVLHLCQGLEFTFEVYATAAPRIEAVYRLPIPKLTVSPHLRAPLERFGSEVLAVSQIVDEEFYRSGRGVEHDPLRVLLPGASQIDIKGIDVGYDAALHARAMGSAFELVRVSPWAPSPAEPKEAAAEFHVELNTAAMVRLIHSCDLAIVPSRKEEGFGLPAAEAMAAGLPVILSEIPSFLAFDSASRDYALWAKEDDGIGMGEELMRLLEDPELRNDLSRRGREVVEQYRGANAGRQLEEHLRRASGG